MSDTARNLEHKRQENLERKVLDCLRCGNPFVSEWRGNRLCRKCNEVNAEGRYEPSRGKLRGLRERGSG